MRIYAFVKLFFQWRMEMFPLIVDFLVGKNRDRHI